jgi:DNA-binding transcriptional ArsR family regulator
MTNDLDQIWKALADETRRTILDFLRSGPKPTTAVVEQFPDLSRFAVMKHLDVLRQAALVVTREEGRQRINALNAVPIRMIYERWVSKYEGIWASTLLRIKEVAERETPAPSPPRATTKTPEPKRKRKARSRN